MPDVLIFDDDAAVGNLLADLAHSKGLSVDYYGSGAGVVQMVLEARPRLVILDVMMPGLDGLSACRDIRANPAANHVKIIVLTAKSFDEDKETARRWGANAFITKPFDVSAVSRVMDKLLSLPSVGLLEAPAPPVQIDFLSGSAALRAGDLWVIFDAGRGLAEWISGQKRAPRECWLFLSRYEKAAFSDLEALGRLSESGCPVKIAGPDDAESSLQRLAPRISGGAARVKAAPLLYPQREGEFQIAPGIQGRAQYTQHPGPTLAYRLLIGGKKIAWCPAHEVDPTPASWRGHDMEKFRDFLAHADLVFHGYRRSQEDPPPKEGLGRGAWEPVVDLAAECQVRTLALFPLPGALNVRGGLKARLEERCHVQGLRLGARALDARESFIL